MMSVSDPRYKLRAVIEFLIAEKETVGNIHKRLCVVYGDCAVDRRTVGLWTMKAKASESATTQLQALPRSGRPVSATTPGMVRHVDVIIRADRRTTEQQLASKLSVSSGRVCAMIKTFGYSKFCAKWVPRSLTAEHRMRRTIISSDLDNIAPSTIQPRFGTVKLPFLRIS